LSLASSVSSHKVPENDNGSVDMVLKEWGRVADQANCAVLLVHHVRKGDQEVTTQLADAPGAARLADYS
jgi:RecA-family ATPase